MAAPYLLEKPTMKSINMSTLLESDDPIQGLAMAIVYSGVVEKDVKFFCSDWAEAIFRYLGIEADPFDWYMMILYRKEREKHGRRRSQSKSDS